MWRSRACPCVSRLDRAGLVGADGQTHAGAFDIAYLGCLPGMVLMAAADEAELVHMVRTAVAIDDRPSGLRYPRGEGFGVDMPEQAEVLPIGKGRVMREGSTVAILSYGARLYEALKAADELATKGISATVADARFAKPLDEELILRLAREHEVLITIEEGSIGGFASQVLHLLALRQVLDGGLRSARWCCPTCFSTRTSHRFSTRRGIERAAHRGHGSGGAGTWRHRHGGSGARLTRAGSTRSSRRAALRRAGRKPRR